jgi:hypothetical protein
MRRRLIRRRLRFWIIFIGLIALRRRGDVAGIADPAERAQVSPVSLSP